MLLRVGLVIVLVVGLVVPTTAQQAPPAPPSGVTVRPVLQTTTTMTGQLLTFPLFRNQVGAVIVELAPGGQTGAQRFQDPAVVYVLDGAVTVEVEGQAPRSFAAGQAFVPPLGRLANATNRGTTTLRFLTTTFGDARRPPVSPPVSAPVGARFTPVIRTTTTWTGEAIVFPLLANQFFVLVADFAPGAINPRHVHPHTQFAYVLAGDASVEADGLPPKVFKPGEAFVETLIPHVGANRGTTLGRVFTIFVGEAGTPPTAPAPPR